MNKEVQIIEQAFQAARDAANAYQAKHGEPFYCGFAWAVVRPGNSRLARVLKEKYGATRNHSGGVMVYNPSGIATQSLDIKEEGAWAFAKVLQDAGYKVTACSRAD